MQNLTMPSCTCDYLSGLPRPIGLDVGSMVQMRNQDFIPCGWVCLASSPTSTHRTNCVSWGNFIMGTDVFYLLAKELNKMEQVAL
jgi:hypothetical protein